MCVDLTLSLSLSLSLSMSSFVLSLYFKGLPVALACVHILALSQFLSHPLYKITNVLLFACLHACVHHVDGTYVLVHA